MVFADALPKDRHERLNVCEEDPTVVADAVHRNAEFRQQSSYCQELWIVG